MSYRTSLPLHPTEDDKPKKKKRVSDPKFKSDSTTYKKGMTGMRMFKSDKENKDYDDMVERRKGDTKFYKKMGMTDKQAKAHAENPGRTGTKKITRKRTPLR